MKNMKSQTVVKGRYEKHNGNFLYKDKLLLSQRKGSVVEVTNNVVLIHTDVVGLDKVYYEIKDNKLIISNVMKDFIGNGADEKFVDFLRKKGFVPYPYTILKNVMKTPPGLITKFSMNKNGEIVHEYLKSSALEIFNVNKRFTKKGFKEELTSIMLENAKDQKEIVSSFSGGFDSNLMTEIYRDKIKNILHFYEDEKIDIESFKKLYPKAKWTIIDNNVPFTEADKKKYFESIDEPCCDSAGFAEYLMAKSMKKITSKTDAAIMNGQLADALFLNGRPYFEDFVSSKVPRHVRTLLSFKQHNKLITKFQNYSMDPKKKFMKFYFGNYHFPNKAQNEEIYGEISKFYDIYRKAINNDSTNLFSACAIMLRSSLYGDEKLKTAAHALNTKYYAPFISENMMRCAFAIPSRYKVGFNLGKRILINTFPEFKRTNIVVVRSFMPERLKERLIGKIPERGEYLAFYADNWLKYNLNM
jgi:asparagine synthetase B (glutamine-hydrolysing)